MINYIINFYSIKSSNKICDLNISDFNSADCKYTTLKRSELVKFLKTDLENELLYLKGSIPGSKNSEVLVKGSVKNIKKLTIAEKAKAAEIAKKTPEILTI